MSRYLASGGPYAVAHRGGAGLAPENTLAAFGRAYDLGFRYLEADIRMTADGVCVAFHDGPLRRSLGVRGRLRDLDWAQVQRLRCCGEPVPSLDQLLAAFPDARFMMDLKDPAALPGLIRALRRHQAIDRVCLAGAGDRVQAHAREAAGPELATAVSWQSMARLAVAARIGAPLAGLAAEREPRAAQFVHVPLRLGRLSVYRSRLVSMAHDLGLRVMVWTVDSAPVMHRLLDDGTDGVITDRPDILREVLVTRGAWTPPAAPFSRAVASPPSSSRGDARPA